MPRVSYNRLSTKKSTVRRKRTSVIAKAKYKPRTTTANRSLIKGNAYAIRALKRLMPSPVYTDWQYSGTLRSTADDTSFSETIRQVQLMSPFDGINALWQPVLRQDVNVTESSSTKVLRMQLNLRYRLGLSNWAQFTTFVVSIRKNATDVIVNEANLTKGQDYITNLGDEFNARLNPAVFKVHYVRNVSLMKNSWVSPAAGVGGNPVAFNPQTTLAKGQVNMKLNFNIRQPTQGASWTAMDQSQFPPNQRLFLLTFIVQQSDAPVQPPGIPESARVNFDALYTCYNAS